MHALVAMALVAGFFAGFGYMQHLAGRCPGEDRCHGAVGAGCGACPRSDDTRGA